jgi:hypothetical protein
MKKTPFPTFPQGGRSQSIFSPLGEIRKGVKIKRYEEDYPGN